MQGSGAATACGTCPCRLQLAVLALVGYRTYALYSAVVTEALEAAVNGVVIVIAIGICQLLAGEHIGQSLEGEGCAHNS